MKTFKEWLERQDNLINPYGPGGHGFDNKGQPIKRHVLINREPSPEEELNQAAIPYLQKASQFLDSDLNSCIENVQRAMEVYTSSGTQGAQNPHYRMLSLLYDKLTKERQPVEVNKQLVDYAIHQLGNLK